MSDTKIEWTDKTWNPITGCSKISPGCAHCYAERMAKRLAGRYGYPKDDPFKVTFHEDKLYAPDTWKPCRIFVCSMGDLFHADVKITWIEQIFKTIRICSKHIFIILTKRPENMKAFFDGHRYSNYTNVWLGVTAENQEWADKRIPILLQIPAAVRFVSVEPMLERMDISPYLWIEDARDYGHERPALDWVICGAETGPGKRPMDLRWAVDLQAQCQMAGVPFFMKKDSDGKYDPLIFDREYPQ